MAHGIVIGAYPDAEKGPHWPAILEMLARGAEGDGRVYDPGEVVWVAIEGAHIIAALTTSMRPDGRAQLQCIGGSRLLHVIGEFEAVVCAWAKDAGASTIVAHKGRGAWARFAPRFGWTLDAEVDGYLAYRKALR